MKEKERDLAGRRWIYINTQQNNVFNDWELGEEEGWREEEEEEEEEKGGGGNDGDEEVRQVVESKYRELM